MSGKASFNDKEFQSAATAILKITKKDPVPFFNKKMFFIVVKAMKDTPRATRAAIEAAMNEFVKIKRTKSGKISRAKNALTYSRRGASLIQGGRLNRGLKPLPKSELEIELRKMLTDKTRAIGSLASGFLGSVKLLGRAIGRKSRPKGPDVKNPGHAIPAKPGRKITVTAVYEMTIKKRLVAIIDPRVRDMFAKAFRYEGHLTREQLTRLLQKKFNKHNARR